MKLIGAILAMCGCVSGAWAQTASAPVVIKDECPWVLGLKFSSNGSDLARFCFGYATVLLDTRTYGKARMLLIDAKYTPQLRALVFSPDGTVFVTAEAYNGARVWSATDTGKPLLKAEGMAYSSSYEVYTLDTPLRVLQAPIRGDSNLHVEYAEFSPDGKLLATIHGTRLMKVWNTSSWTVEKELMFSPEDRLEGMLFSPDSKVLVTEAKGRVNIWNTNSWTEEGELPVSEGRLTAAAFTPDSKTVMVADEQGVLHQWNLASKTEMRTLRTYEKSARNDFSVAGLAFSRDGETLMATTLMAAKPVILWKTTEWIPETETGYNSATFSKDGKWLALGGRDCIQLMEPVSRKKIREIELPELTRGELGRTDEKEPDTEKLPCAVAALAFSPDGRTLAAGCSLPEGTVRVIQVNL